MTVTAIALAAIAILLAWPVPLIYARAVWPLRAPATALVVWQAIALAGGLSMVGAPLALALVPYGDDLLTGAQGFFAAVAAFRVSALAVGFLLIALGLGCWLLAHLVSTVVHVQGQRRRHLSLVLLLSSAHPTRAHTHVLDDAAPVAYCLPGGASSVTVVSRGIVELLTPDEVDAVIEHEFAHLRQRHDVVLVAFRAWRSALPRLRVTELAEARVAELVEMLADDRARTRVEVSTLAAAIARVGAAAGGDAAEEAARRIVRLRAAPLDRTRRWAAVAGSVALVAVPTAWLAVPVIVDVIG